MFIDIFIASMPIKCIAQMPMPIATPPPLSHTQDEAPLLVETRPAMFRAV